VSNNEETQTPFSRYRDGYIDGYEGNSQKFEDDEYARGYYEGHEDDKLGVQKKYDNLQILPVSPAVITLMSSAEEIK